MTSNTPEQVDLSFNRLSFIQGLGAEASVRGGGDKVPYKNSDGGGPSPSTIEKNCEELFLLNAWMKKIYQRKSINVSIVR